MLSGSLAGPHLKRYRYRRALGNVLERGSETPAAQNGRVDAAGQLAKLLVGALGSLQCLLHELGGARIAVAQLPLGELQRDDRLYQPLLGTVVQVPLDPATRLVGRRDDPAARSRERGTALGIRDRGRDQLGELPEAGLGGGAGRFVLCPRGQDQAPGVSRDNDRRRECPADGRRRRAVRQPVASVNCGRGAQRAPPLAARRLRRRNPRQHGRPPPHPRRRARPRSKRHRRPRNGAVASRLRRAKRPPRTPPP